MIQTPIEKLQPGMVLTQDVLDRSGRLLAKAHTKLTEKHITVLKTWGVSEAAVKGDNESSPQTTQEERPISPQALEQANEITQYLFSKSNPEHPAMKELYSLCVQRIARKLSKGGE